MSVNSYTTRFAIAADHPSLPGHFSGHPVVPGVVLLDRVATALAAWRGQTIAALPQVKFLSPLLPGQTADLTLEATSTSRLRFRITRDEQLVSSGEIDPA